MATVNERRSHMAHSSIHAPAKKDGAGGAYTFGSAKDTEDYGDMAGPPMQPTGVVVEPVSVPTAPPARAAEFAMQPDDFPRLGGPDCKAAPPQRKEWGASAEKGGEATGKLDPSNLRQGVEFDSSHPRNQFAKKPHHQEGGATIQQVPGNIDWTGDGVPKEVQSKIIKGSQNPAHLSAHQQPAPQVPLKDLKVQTKHVAPAERYPDKAASNHAPKPQREPVSRGR
jgi:hypothetical protein